jgi:protein-disulfide isomerase
MKLTQLRGMLALTGLAAMLAMPVNPALKAAENNAFSDMQRQEIEGVVREYLLKNPEILREMMTALEAKESHERSIAQSRALSENADAIFRSANDIVLGNPKGDVTLVEFFDYNCGFCKRALKDLQKLLETDKNLKIVIKEYPILSAGSLEAARVSLAASRQGNYLEFHSALLSARGQADGERALKLAKKLGLDMDKLKADMDKPEIDESLASVQKLARRLGISGTPAYIIGDAIIPGAVGIENLRAQIAKIRKTGCKNC